MAESETFSYVLMSSDTVPWKECPQCYRPFAGEVSIPGSGIVNAIQCETGHVFVLEWHIRRDE